MRTNVPDVFCGGDLAIFPLAMAKNQMVNIGHWQMAQAQGNVENNQLIMENLGGTKSHESILSQMLVKADCLAAPEPVWLSTSWFSHLLDLPTQTCRAACCGHL